MLDRGDGHASRPRARPSSLGCPVEFERAIDTIIQQARSLGDVPKLRRLRAWRPE